ncbi:glycosyltransferase [Staphylospora marina]|uniref:glycosyltransferase n=1 Tax=Staphylospora marina TaxID=2490858 RepID=UPI0019D2C35A|nr:glycosyltransferase [Staphylospora marina]
MRDKVLGYLSAAPRVSTSPHAEASGPRAHVLGVIQAFERLGWQVERFIVGDRMRRDLANKKTEKMLTANPVQTFAADVARIVLGKRNARKAWEELGPRVNWVYERHAVLQSLGWIFKKHGIPWILETNGIFFEEAKKDRKAIVLDGIAREMEIKAYRDCDVLVAVSRPLKEQIVERLHIDPDKILVVPNGVDTHFYRPQEGESRDSDMFTVGFVGSILAWQGLDHLIRAVGELREEGIDVRVIIVGDGLVKAELEEMTREAGLADRITFTGRVPADEVPAWISRFDVGFSGQVDLKTQKMYHSPLKIYEYMSMAKPVVASAHDDARMLIEGKETGFLFRPGDVEDLKGALKRAISSRDRLPEMGRTAREEILNNHSWDARVRGMIEEIERILQANREKAVMSGQSR